jgi:hypothetical protein
MVEWSEDDGAFVGQCPGVIGPSCHGLDEVEVCRELCEIVEEWLNLACQRGNPVAQRSGATIGWRDGMLRR